MNHSLGIGGRRGGSLNAIDDTAKKPEKIVDSRLNATPLPDGGKILSYRAWKFE